MKFGREKRTDRIEIRVEPLLKELFWDVADEKGLSMSDFARELMIREAKRFQRQLNNDKTSANSD